MKTTMGLAGLMTTAALLIGGCADTGPTYTVDAVTFTDGTQGWRVICHGVLENSAVCLAQINRVCSTQGFHVMESIEKTDRADRPVRDPREVLFACGPKPQPVDPTPPPPPPPPPPVVVHVFSLNAQTLFSFDKAELLPSGRAQLTEIAQQIIQNREAESPSSTIEVSGYADRIGGDSQRNQRLSETRAQAVAQFLAQQGIPGDRLKAVGKGVAPGSGAGCPPGRSSAAIQCLSPDRKVTIVIR